MAIPWGDWASLGGPSGGAVAGPVVQSNQDGRLEVFVCAPGGVFSVWQVAVNGAWHGGWAEHGAPASGGSIAGHVVGRNADGRQEIFAVTGDGVLWHRWQTAPDNGWSGWASLNAPEKSPLTSRFTVGQNQDGRQEAFCLGGDGQVWQIWQTSPNGGWSPWRQLGGPPAGIRASDRLAVARNEDGRQELFAMGADGALWHVWQQAPNAGWSQWQSLGRPRDSFDGSEPPKDRDLSDPLVRRNADGHLEAFCPGNGAFCNRWQERWRDGPDHVVWRHQGWNAKPRPRPEVGLTWLDGALNRNSRLEVTGLADDGALWHAWQVDTPPFWSSWESLGTPPGGLRQAGHTTVGTSPDGRLEAFVAGQDGAVWHIGQLA